MLTSSHTRDLTRQTVNYFCPVLKGAGQRPNEISFSTGKQKLHSKDGKNKLDHDGSYGKIDSVLSWVYLKSNDLQSRIELLKKLQNNTDNLVDEYDAVDPIYPRDGVSREKKHFKKLKIADRIKKVEQLILDRRKTNIEKRNEMEEVLVGRYSPELDENLAEYTRRGNALENYKNIMRKKLNGQIDRQDLKYRQLRDAYISQGKEISAFNIIKNLIWEIYWGLEDIDVQNSGKKGGGFL